MTGQLKVLVTGGAGFIGSTLVRILLKEGHEVTVLDNLQWGIGGLRGVLDNPALKFVEGDVRDERLVSGLLEDKAVVVHLAAYVSQSLCENNKKQAADVNVNGSKVLSEHLSDNQLLIYASTGSVYGQSGFSSCTEKTTPQPNSQYAQTKYEAEQLFAKKDNAVILRFATAFGASYRMRLDLLVNQFVYEAIKNKELTVVGKDYPRSTVHVRDIANAVLFAIHNSASMRGETFNVGASEVYTKGQIAQAIRQQVDFNLHYAESPTNPGRDYQLYTGKIEALGYHANVSLNEGITELVSTVGALKVDRSCFNFQEGSLT